MSALLFDCGGTTSLRLEGRESLDLLHRISTNALAKLPPGAAAETLFVTDKGRLIDRCMVLAREGGAQLLCSPAAAPVVRAWIEKFIIMEDVTVEEAPAARHLVVIGNPGGLPGFAGMPEPGRWADTCTVEGESAPGMTAVRGPFFGLDRTDLLIPGDGAGLLRAVGRLGVAMQGAPAWEEFRIERLIPAFGAEIVDRYNPFEVGLAAAVSFTKGCYVGQEVIARLDTYRKVQREPAGVVLPGGMPRGRLPLALMREAEEIGALTSCVTTGPGGGVRGIAVLRRGSARIGDTLTVFATGEPVEVVAHL